MELYLDHQEDEARAAEAKVNNVLELLLKNGLCAGLKCALSESGFDVGRPRKPFGSYDRKTKEKLMASIRQNLI